MNDFVRKISFYLSFFDICFDDTEGWFPDAYTNTLYKIDLVTNAISVEAAIPTGNDIKDAQYGFSAKWKNLLVLAPRSEDKIAIYNIVEKIFRTVPLDIEYMKGRKIYNLFSGIHIFQDYAYLIPGRFPAIVRLDLHTFEITYIDSWYKEIRNRIMEYEEERVIFARCGCRDENKLLLPCWQGSIVMEFNMETEKTNLIDLFFDDVLSEMYVNNQKMFIASRAHPVIYKCDMDGNMLEQIELQALGETGISFLFTYRGKAIAVPVYGNRVIQYDFSIRECQGLIELAEEENENYYVEKIFPHVGILSCFPDDNGNLWMYSAFNDTIVKFNMNTGNVEQMQAVLSKKEAKKKALFYIEHMKNVCCEEDSLFTISDFCIYIREYKE